MTIEELRTALETANLVAAGYDLKERNIAKEILALRTMYRKVGDLVDASNPLNYAALNITPDEIVATYYPLYQAALVKIAAARDALTIP